MACRKVTLTFIDCIAFVLFLFTKCRFMRWFHESDGQQIPFPHGLFAVDWAPSEKEKKAVIWLYRTFDVPDRYDWEECLLKFKLDTVPQHSIRNLATNSKSTVAIDLKNDHYSVIRINESEEIVAEGQITIGSLTPGSLLGCH